METLTTGTSGMCDRTTLSDTGSAISSPGLADGPMPYVCANGRTIERFGRGVVRVSHSQSQVSNGVLKTQDIFGRNGCESFDQTGQDSFLVSKLKMRFGM